jgi:hypothetical protein
LGQGYSQKIWVPKDPNMAAQENLEYQTTSRHKPGLEMWASELGKAWKTEGPEVWYGARLSVLFEKRVPREFLYLVEFTVLYLYFRFSN